MALRSFHPCTVETARPSIFAIGRMPPKASMIASAGASAAAPADCWGSLLPVAVLLLSPPWPSDVVMVSSRNFPARLQPTCGRCSYVPLYAAQAYVAAQKSPAPALTSGQSVQRRQERVLIGAPRDDDAAP